ncbi:hypothetical protein [Mycobacterium sp. NPDC004974]
MSIEAIDAELRVLVAYRAACAQDGDPVRTTAVVDKLLDERLPESVQHGPKLGVNWVTV